MKEYKNMNEEEQARWVRQFSDYLGSDYLTMKTKSDGWRAAFERGLTLLEPFTMCKTFVDNSRQFIDYERRIKRMTFFIEELRKQVIEVDGNLLQKLVDSPQKRRRGRPTAAESKAIRHEQALKDSGKIEAVARLAGINTPKSDSVIQNRASAVKAVPQVGNLFEVMAEQRPEHEPEHEKASRLQDIKHLLSGELQEAVDNIAIIRSQAATESELAKQAAVAGESQEDVARHAQNAAELTEKYKKLYRAIDEDLARMYISARLWKESVVAGEKREDVLAKTEYYYKKVTSENPTFEGLYLSRLAALKENGDEDGKQGITDKEKKKILKNIRDYFLRKNIKPSEARLQKMEEKMEQVKKLGASTEEYELIYATEKERLSHETE